MSEQISLKEIDGMLENQQVDNQADSNVTEETPNETVTFSLADIDAMLDEGEKKPDFAAAKKASDALNGTGSVPSNRLPRRSRMWSRRMWNNRSRHRHRERRLQMASLTMSEANSRPIKTQEAAKMLPHRPDGAKVWLRLKHPMHRP